MYKRRENEYHPGEKRYLISSLLYADFIQEQISSDLATVNDIIKNYEIILKYIDSLEMDPDDIDDPSFSIWFDDKYNKNIIYFNTVEYLIFKKAL